MVWPYDHPLEIVVNLPIQARLTLSAELMEQASFNSYRIKDVNPLSGVVKFRNILAPNPAMRTIHTLILQWLRSFWVSLPYATAVKKGSSILHNVRPHRQNRYFYMLDLRDAYTNVSSAKLAAVIATVTSDRYDPQDVLTILDRFCMSPRGGLATGGPASPELFNLFAGILIDLPLAGLLERWGDVTYTRYLDDLTFSSPHPFSQRRRQRILRIIRAAGFTHNREKARLVDLAIEKAMAINGVGLKYGGEIFVPRPFLGKLYILLKEGANGQTITPEMEQMIAGYMGVYRAIIRRGDTSQRAERRIEREYRWYRKQVEEQHWERGHARRQRRRSYRRRQWLALSRGERNLVLAERFRGYRGPLRELLGSGTHIRL